MNFLLTSAGLSNESIINSLVSLVGKKKEDISFVFIPTAANIDAGDKGWLIENLIEIKNQNFKSVDIIDISAVPRENWTSRFNEADVLCFGGGNEQYLAKVFEDTEMKKYLDGCTNKTYMGISAGSMVVGQLINHSLMRLIYPEESYEELADGLNLIDISIIPHLNSTWFTHVRKENLDSLKLQFTNTIYALDDETALEIKGGEITVIGNGDSWVLVQ